MHPEHLLRVCEMAAILSKGIWVNMLQMGLSGSNPFTSLWRDLYPASWWSYLQRCFPLSGITGPLVSGQIYCLPELVLTHHNTNIHISYLLWAWYVWIYICMYTYLFIGIYKDVIWQCTSWRKCVLWNIYASVNWVIWGPGNSLLPFWSLSAPMPIFVDLITKNKLQRN